MIHSAVAVTNQPDSASAGADLGSQIAQRLAGESPDAVILIASERYQQPLLLEALTTACRPSMLVGGSSQAAFSSRAGSDQMACAVALRAPPSEMRFTPSIGRAVRTNPAAAVRELVAGFHGLRDHDYAFRSALILSDWLAGDSQALLDLLTVETGGNYQLFGGGVGGDDLLTGHNVFLGRDAIPNAVVALEILSNKPVGIGVCHGWQPASAPMRVTEADGSRLVSLNAIAAGDVFRQHADLTGQAFDAREPLPFFLHNVLGFQTSEGHKLRVPLQLHADGSVECAADVPTGTAARIMQTNVRSSADAAAIATRAAEQQLGGLDAQVALVLDCAATRLRMGTAFGAELEAIKGALPSVSFAGFTSVGQIARADGQFSGFHNCTAVVCVLPG